MTFEILVCLTIHCCSAIIMHFLVFLSLLICALNNVAAKERLLRGGRFGKRKQRLNKIMPGRKFHKKTGHHQAGTGNGFVKGVSPERLEERLNHLEDKKGWLDMIILEAQATKVQIEMEEEELIEDDPDGGDY